MCNIWANHYILPNFTQNVQYLGKSLLLLILHFTLFCRKFAIVAIYALFFVKLRPQNFLTNLMSSNIRYIFENDLRFPNCHEFPVASGLGNLTTQHICDAVKVVNVLHWWWWCKACGNALHMVIHCTWWSTTLGGTLHMVMQDLTLLKAQSCLFVRVVRLTFYRVNITISSKHQIHKQ